AQTPQAFNYQGVARDAAGMPLINKLISLRIAILRESTPTFEVYKEEHSVTTNKLGLFSIEVGNGNPVSGTFNTIDWGAGVYFIQLEIDPGGGSAYQLIGTTQLLSVPYALYAASSGDAASSQWADIPGGIFYGAGNIGIGTLNPARAIDIVKTVGNGDGRFMVKLKNPSTSNRSFAGIALESGVQGTQTSLSHIAESYDFEGTKLSGFGQLTNNGAGIIIRADSPTAVIKFLAGYQDAASAPERMRITNNGNVGIGTEDPKSKLQIQDGDVYLDNSANGVILKSPDGNCWRLTVGNNGVVSTTSITCPN
ncbi:MAG TPA: hypothetical protein VJ508_01460, partial [Saprospiraceae bacterium]|nr:hypothetical protein [Saprospiraceae bacterium]